MPPTSTPRPSRATVQNELGRRQSLLDGPEQFRTLCGHGPEVVLLGLGPRPEALQHLLLGASAHTAAVRYVECPNMAVELGPDWRARIPAGWTATDPQDLPALAELARSGAIFHLYTPGPRLFPSFWQPILARIQLALLAQAPTPRPKLAWVPGDQGDLLRLELSEALAECGWTVRETATDGGPLDLSVQRELLAGGECPQLFLSVNFRGLDPLGEAAALLAASGAKIAVWCVDNPLHLLSGLKSRFWQELPLFVTDDWFVGPLRTLGAAQVHHLPLATRASDLDRQPASPSHNGTLLFVGRSAFPGKEGFFAGCALPEQAFSEARTLLARGERPDFGWWLERLGIDESEQGQLWPGAQVRQAGYAAEETGKAWRTQCLTAAQQNLGNALHIYGDEGWRDLLPAGASIQPPVDYYTQFPDLVAGATCCLNCTSPLLPHGLTQRHFDTWAWGGTLITDATPGLNIFPPELTQPITYRTSEEITPLFRTLAMDPALRGKLGAAWRELLYREHTYAHRLRILLELIDAAG